MWFQYPLLVKDKKDKGTMYVYNRIKLPLIILCILIIVYIIYNQTVESCPDYEIYNNIPDF